MTRFLMSSLSSKAQLTVPKEVRAILGLGGKGTLVGFLVDTKTRSVRLARVDATVQGEELSAAECRRILGLRRAPGRRKFKTMAALLKDLKS